MEGNFWGEEGRDVDFPSQLVFGAGLAHPVPATPVAVQYDLLLVTFTFFRDTGVIQDAEGNLICDIASRHLRNLLVGRCIYTDLEVILEGIQRTYLGAGRRSLQVCMKDAYDKIRERGGGIAVNREKCCNFKNGLDRESVIMYNDYSDVVCYPGEPDVEAMPLDTLCITAFSKTGSRNPITKVHERLMGSFLVDPRSGVIRGVEFNTICKLTNRFLRAIIEGKSLKTDVDDLAREIQERYFGDSRRAIVTILKDAQNRFLTCQAGETPSTRDGLGG